MGCGNNITISACITEGEVSPPNDFNLCTLNPLDQTAVDNATLVNIAACVDGEPSLIPYSTPSQTDICGLPNTPTFPDDVVHLAACVNGYERLIPLPNLIDICGLDTVDQDLVNAAPDVNVAVCIEGSQVTVPSDAIIPSDKTWSPGIAGSTSPGVFTYSTQDGRYIEIGKRVFFNINLDGDWGSSFTGELIISLPTTTNIYNSVVVADIIHDNVSADSNIVGIIEPNSNFIILHKYTTNGDTIPITHSDQVNTNNKLTINGFYIKA